MGVLEPFKSRTSSGVGTERLSLSQGDSVKQQEKETTHRTGPV